uniref:Uncharacterized protein n=1 Tax=Rhizophora mucronata TaxID=61149 RepID=A0A2P2PTP6_RHIMU
MISKEANLDGSLDKQDSDIVVTFSKNYTS